MDCDQVFMVLTSGPFPTGAPSDVDVEDHLVHCPDCWRIAEALRPAHDVFEESIPASEGRDLPGYWGDSLPARAVIAQLQRTATRTAPAPRHRLAPQIPYPSPANRRRTAAWRDLLFIGGFVVAVCSVALLLAFLRP